MRTNVVEKSRVLIVLSCSVWMSPGYGVLDSVSLWFFMKCRHRYAVSSLMDMAYRMLEQARNEEGTSGGNNARNNNANRKGGGLKDEISMPLRMFKLKTLADAFCMAKMQEATNAAIRPRYTSIQSNYKSNNVGGSDQRYNPGHKCSEHVYSLEVTGESEGQEECKSEQLVVSNEEDDNVEMCNDVFENYGQGTPQISLNALSGVHPASFQKMEENKDVYGSVKLSYKILKMFLQYQLNTTSKVS
nr:hypothetical protein [Tanacetum cinerariifolium]